MTHKAKQTWNKVCSCLEENYDKSKPRTNVKMAEMTTGHEVSFKTDHMIKRDHVYVTIKLCWNSTTGKWKGLCSVYCVYKLSWATCVVSAVRNSVVTLSVQIEIQSESQICWVITHDTHILRFSITYTLHTSYYIINSYVCCVRHGLNTCGGWRCEVMSFSR